MGIYTGEVNLRAGSHIPVLYKLFQATKGAVLELGAGFNSTPLLYWICKWQDRYFVSYENDLGWIAKMQYPIKYTQDWSKEHFENSFWDIVLVDCRPALERHRLAIRLKDSSNFVVLHDSEPEIDRFYAYRRVYPHFKYRYDFTLTKPYTTVLSNFIDPSLYIDDH